MRRLYAAQPLHAGLIILIPAVDRALQRKLFRAALDELAVIGEPVNRVLEVDLNGDDVTLALYDLPTDTRCGRVEKRAPADCEMGSKAIPGARTALVRWGFGWR